MKIFIDTADVEAIRKAKEMGIHFRGHDKSVTNRGGRKGFPYGD